MLNIILTTITAFITLFIPGELFALALLRKKTNLNLFEISIFGFILGLIAPATLTWAEGYLSNSMHIFAYSLGLFEANAVVLSIIGLILCVQQGVLFSRDGSITRKSAAKDEIKAINTEERKYRNDINSIREGLSKYESAKSVIHAHIEQEELIRQRQNEELSRAGNLTQDELRSISAAHARELDRITKDHEQEESSLLSKLERDPNFTQQAGSRFSLNLRQNWVWALLLLIMLVAFSAMMLSIVIAPHFFIFDPYFDMLAAKSILAFGHQYYLSTSAWPVVPAGTVMRVEPLIPYLEAYWYSLAGFFGANVSTFNQSLMSYVGGVYPPITGALLVFIVFVLIYHEYDKYTAIIAASLAAMMPIIFNTFIAGEQLLEPWGIFSLFFFFATYMLAIRNMNNHRYAILAGVAFASTFLGAHYFTVDTGILAFYILAQGIISLVRNDLHKDFYKMNAIVLIIISLFLVVYMPYRATLSGRIPTILHLPITIMFPLIALILVGVLHYLVEKLSPRLEKNPNITYVLSVISIVGIVPMAIIAAAKKSLKQYIKPLSRYAVISIIMVILVLLILATPLGGSVKGYLELSTKFTTPSSALFMTVQEYAPTGIGYNFFAGGFGLIGANIAGIPILVWAIVSISILLIITSIIFQNSKTGVLYLAIALPLIAAAVSEVKYLPHFAAAYVMLFGITLGESIYLLRNGLHSRNGPSQVHKPRGSLILLVFSIGIFFISPILAMIYILVLIFMHKVENPSHAWAIFMLFLIIEVSALLVNHSLMSGEVKTLVASFSAASVYSANPAAACSTLARTNAQGVTIYCNTVQQYWITAAAWMSTNVGPYAPRILAWWDYGDWINWFGNTNAVLRGDNSVAKEDYATAASFVLGQRYGYGSSTLANVMNGNQSEYVLFDEQLIQKWGALDFLACVHINATSEAYAISQAKQQNQSAPYLLGTSNCETLHDPQYALIPISALISNASTSSSLSNYCALSTSTPYITTYLVNGYSLSNQTMCTDPVSNANGVLSLYYSNGTKSNAVIQQYYNEGVVNIQGTQYVEFMAIYLPNAPNGTITDAPSDFYTSNFYNGFFLGNLAGFTEVYPATNGTAGVNLINYTNPLVIFKLNNYTGGLSPVASKPSYIKNNYTIP